MIGQPLKGELRDIALEQAKAESDLLSMPNVVGVAVGRKYKGGRETDQYALQVLVNQKIPQEFLPQGAVVSRKVGKFDTDVIDVGTVFAQQLLEPTSLAQYGNAPQDGAARVISTTTTLPSAVPLAPVAPTVQLPTAVSVVSVPQILKQRIRPCMGGFSVGHPAVTAGTIATCCYDVSAFPGIPQRYYILSNNHVLANSNNANIGDPILQPGSFDGGTLPADVVGRLARFIPILFHTPTTQPLNLVDAAIAEVPFHDASREIYWLGYLSKGLAAPEPGDILQKTGRTTNFSTGRVISINATLDVNYSAGKVARFAQQIVTTAMSAGGDSGSLVTDLEERAVGLLFAGSSTVTILNPINMVTSLLKIKLTE